VTVIAIMTLGLAIPLLRLTPDFVVADAHQRSLDAATANSDLPPAPIVYRDKLLELMTNGADRKTG
jgi:hypothetical protein